jgi:hypothetical protein
LCTVARITSAAAVIVSTRADEPFFSASAHRISSELRRDLAVALAKAGAATTRSEVPATPPSLRLGAPVSQRYRDVEDALIGLRLRWELADQLAHALAQKLGSF